MNPFGGNDTIQALAVLMAMQQQEPKNKWQELQPPKEKISVAEALRQYKPTKEQRLQALADMANTSKDKMIQGIADYEISKYNRENDVQIPRHIEMPTLEFNRSKHKAVNFFWDKLESILPK